MNASLRTGYYGFKVIGALKLLSGLIALAVGMGTVRFLAHDPGPKLERAVTHLGLDPQNQAIHTLISKVTGIDRTHLRAIEAGTFFYAILHLIEGIGLILEQDWAGYLVVVATSTEACHSDRISYPKWRVSLTADIEGILSRLGVHQNNSMDAMNNVR